MTSKVHSFLDICLQGLHSTVIIPARAVVEEGGSAGCCNWGCEEAAGMGIASEVLCHGGTLCPHLVDVLGAISHFWGFFYTKTVWGHVRGSAANVPSMLTVAQLAARGHCSGRG